MPDPRDVGESGFSDDMTNIGLGGWESMVSKLNGVVSAPAQKQNLGAQTAAAVSPVVNQLNSIVQKQSAVATLLSAGLAKQTGGPGLLGSATNSVVGLGAGALTLGFADKLLAGGRTGVSGNEAWWRELQTEAGEHQRPSTRVMDAIRNVVEPALGSALNAGGKAFGDAQKGAVGAVVEPGYWGRRGDAIGAAVGALSDGRNVVSGPGAKYSWQGVEDFGYGMAGGSLNFDRGQGGKLRGGAQVSGDESPKTTARDLIDQGIIPRPNTSRDFPGLDPTTGHPGGGGFGSAGRSPWESGLQSAMDKLRNGNGAVSFGSKQV